jgi:hypothetical protein
MLNNLGFKSQQEQEMFLFSKMCGLALGPTKPPIQWMPGILSLGVKWLGDEAELHTVPSLRMSGAISPLLLYTFMAYTVTTFTFYLCFVQNKNLSFSHASVHCMC